MSAPNPRKAYWGRNLRYVGFLLAVWLVVAYGFGILLVEPLNSLRVGGFRVGFWFAQQGSIYVFVALVFIYARLMRRLDRACDLDEEEAQR
jgi:putative solute:sodium symporter small subunit